jgi:hypothetical protein
VLKVFGMRPGFNQTPCGIDGWSRSRRRDDTHARAVGMAELPLDIAVEIEMVVAVDASA